MTGAIRQMRPLTGTKGGLCSGVIGGGISPTSIVRACHTTAGHHVQYPTCLRKGQLNN